MADKEATVYVIDVGRSMGEKHQGRDQSDLDWSLQYIWDKITNTVLTGRKTLQLGIVGLGTDTTNNRMKDDPSYGHISILQEITQFLMPELQNLATMLTPSKTGGRDVLSAIIIAVDMLMEHCRQLKYKKKIVVVTNATGQMDEDDVEITAEQIKRHGIELVILGVDFDDSEYGFKEEDKQATKAKNERILKRLVDHSGGTIATMQEAIDSLARPPIRSVRPTPTYKGQLRLGDPENYDTAISIDVERYFKTAIKRPPTASAYVLKGVSQPQDSDSLTAVHPLYSYSIQNENAPDGRQTVPREELAKGYEYGRTVVPISESDLNITKLETDMAYEILGFIPAENVERYMLLDNANMLVAQKGNDKAAWALSSLIHALFELGSVAIARFVKKDMAEPVVTLLSPLVETDIECLIENVLPFAEDIRSYRFPPLDKVLTVSGKSLTQHRNLPGDELLHAMDDYVDRMSLVNDDGQEYMAMDDTFSPVLHTIEGAIKYRAVHPDEGIPEKAAAFLAYAKQPEELQTRSKEAVARLIRAADVKKVPPKLKGRRRYHEPETPLSGLDVEALLRKEKRSRISADNAVPEFKQALAATDDLDTVKDLLKQMIGIIENQIRDSFGDANYDRVVEGLGVMREEMLGLEEPVLYNDALRQLKSKIMAEELGVNRKELWWRIRINKLGLIDHGQSPVSDVTQDEADAFMISK